MTHPRDALAAQRDAAPTMPEEATFLNIDPESNEWEMDWDGYTNALRTYALSLEADLAACREELALKTALVLRLKSAITDEEVGP